VIQSILRSGKLLANERKDLGSPLMFEWHESYYLGAAHGIAGILYLLLLVSSILKYGISFRSFKDDGFLYNLIFFL
jgi:hypothetical protein